MARSVCDRKSLSTFVWTVDLSEGTRRGQVLVHFVCLDDGGTSLRARDGSKRTDSCLVSWEVTTKHEDIAAEAALHLRELARCFVVDLGESSYGDCAAMDDILAFTQEVANTPFNRKVAVPG